MWFKLDMDHNGQTWPSMVNKNVIYCWGGAGTGVFFQG